MSDWTGDIVVVVDSNSNIIFITKFYNEFVILIISIMFTYVKLVTCLLFNCFGMFNTTKLLSKFQINVLPQYLQMSDIIATLYYIVTYF